MSLNKQIAKLLETKSAPKGFHFTRDGKLKRGDADQDGPGGDKLRSDPLDKQRSKVPPVSETRKFGYDKINQEYQKITGKSLEQKTKEYADLSNKLAKQKTEYESELAKRRQSMQKEEKQTPPFEPNKPSKPVTPGKHGQEVSKVKHLAKQGMKKYSQVKEGAELDEAVSVKKQNYTWGKMITVHNGSDTSYPLHPEHQSAIAKLKSGEKTSFKDETKRTVHAEREGDKVHLSSKDMNKKTTIAHSHFTEQVNSFAFLRAHLQEKTLTPAEKKKREEIAQAIERENPNMPMAMKMAIATKTAKRVAEEVDDEGKMAKGQLMRMVNQASALAQMMDDDKQLDGWVQSKLTMASDYLDSVHDYLMHNKQDVDEPEDMEDEYGR